MPRSPLFLCLVLALGLAAPAAAQVFDDARPIGGLRGLPRQLPPQEPPGAAPEDDLQGAERWRAMIRSEPHVASHHHALGLALLELDRVAEAADALGEAIRLAPDAASYHASLGGARLALREWQAAETAFARAAALDPGSASYHRGWGVALLEQGHAAQAAAAFHEAVRLQPDDADYSALLGRAVAEMNAAPAPAGPETPAASRPLLSGSGLQLALALAAGVARFAIAALLVVAGAALLGCVAAFAYLFGRCLPPLLLRRAPAGPAAAE